MPIFHMNASHLQASETLPIPLPHSTRRICLIDGKTRLSNSIVRHDSSDLEDGIDEVHGDSYEAEVGILNPIPTRGIYVHADSSDLVSIFPPLHAVNDSK